MRLETGGWTRQVTSRELGVSKNIAGVNMRLNRGGVRELHWHKASEWAYMLYGNARITAVDAQGRNFVDDVGVGDLWFFPAGIPHSIQGLNPDGCEFLLVFDDGDFDEDNTFPDLRLVQARTDRGARQELWRIGLVLRAHP
jgi:oxalate decarboxylase